MALQAVIGVQGGQIGFTEPCAERAGPEPGLCGDV